MQCTLRAERVVYGHERHVLRHPEPPASERPQDPDDHEVVRHHQGRGRAVPQEPFRGTLAAVDPMRRDPRYLTVSKRSLDHWAVGLSRPHSRFYGHAQHTRGRTKKGRGC
jgi:hypothetical protein